MKDSGNNLLKRFSIYTIGPIISAIMGFIIVPVTTWYVAPEELGKLSMFLMVIAISSLLSIMGIDGGFLREYNTRKNKGQLLQNSFIIPITIAILLSFIIFYYNYNISKLLFGEENRYLIFLIVFAIIFTVLKRFNEVLVRTLERPWLYSASLIFEKLINIILLLYLLIFVESSFESIATAQVVALTITATILMMINHKYWFTKFIVDKELIKNLVLFGLPMLPALLMTYWLSAIDKVALRIWADFSELGIYSVALKIVGVLTIIKTSFANFWSPTAYRWFETKVKNEKFIKVSHLVSSFSLVVFGVLILVKEYIVLILDPQYLSAALVIPFLLLVPISEIMNQTTGKGISFSRKTAYNSIASFIAVVINIIGNYLLVPPYGAIGASIATGVSFVIYFWIRTLISRKLWFDFPIKHFQLITLIMVLMPLSSILFNIKIVDIIFMILILMLTKKDIIYIVSYLSRGIRKN